MATYGLDRYGVTTYGVSALVEYDADPFTATSEQTGQLTLRWNPPQGLWDRIRLVRNAYGNSVTADDGLVLFDVPEELAGTEHTDIGLAEGAWFYYSLWVREPVGVGFVWRRVADTAGLVTREHGYPNLLLERLPSVWTTRNREVGGRPDPDTQIARFLSLFGFELNVLRTSIASLRHTQDPDRMPAVLLPLAAQQLGQVYEPAIGQAQNRVLIRNSAYLYKMKGTSTAATGLATSITSWPATLTDGTNLLLEVDDSTPDQTTGQWAVANGAAVLSRVPEDEEPHDATSLVSLGGTAVFGLLATDAGRVELRLPGGRAGVPVTAGETYTVSAHFRDRGTARSPRVAVAFYDHLGELVEQTPEQAGASTATNDWSCRVALTALAPEDAVYLAAVLVWPTLDDEEEQLFDGVQVELAGSASDFTTARAVRLVLGPTRRNIVANPAFKTSIDGWQHDGDGQVARYDDIIRVGETDAAMRVTPGTSAGSASTELPLEPLRTYTSSAWVYGPGGVYAIALGELGAATRAVPADTWTRLSITRTTGESASAERLYVAGPAGATFRVASVLAETGVALQPYFDGDTTSGETGWAGTPHSSPSVYYRQRVIRDNRLRDNLPRYLPHGVGFELAYEDSFIASF